MNKPDLGCRCRVNVRSLDTAQSCLRCRAVHDPPLAPTSASEIAKETHKFRPAQVQTSPGRVLHQEQHTLISVGVFGCVLGTLALWVTGSRWACTQQELPITFALWLGLMGSLM